MSALMAKVGTMGSRGAVERAIELSKSRRDITWEESSKEEIAALVPEPIAKKRGPYKPRQPHHESGALS